jgi:hypothetical protein
MVSKATLGKEAIPQSGVDHVTKQQAETSIL